MKLYVVQKGDTMEDIARKHGMTIDEFRKMNTGLTDDSLAYGMKVKVAIGKQPLRQSASDGKRSEHVHHAPAQQPAAQAVPQQPSAAPAEPKTTNAAEEQKTVSPAANASEPSGDYDQVLYPKHPATGDSGWSPNVSGTYPSFAPASGSEGNSGQAMSPSTQTANQNQAPGFTAQPANPGQMMAPAAQPANMMGQYVQPAMPGNAVNPYYSNPVAGASTPNTVYHPSVSAAQPYYPQTQPWKGKQQQYPFGDKPVTLNQAYTDGKNTAGKKSMMPWTNTQSAGSGNMQQTTQMAPAAGSQQNPAAGAMGSYPPPYMPAKSNKGKPCNCGSPASPYGAAPTNGYYGGNLPPQPQPLPYWAMQGVSAPVYHPQANPGKAQK